MESPSSQSAAMEQVNNFWSILDDLAQNDPGAYKGFIERQMRDREEYFSPPQPHTCIRANVQKPEEGILYVNICGWKRVPTPTSPNKPVPVCGGRLEMVAEQKENYHVVEVAFNPDVLQRAEKDRHEMEQIYHLVHNFVQQQHKLSLSQHFTVIKTKLKGSIQDVKRRLMSPGLNKPSNLNQQSEPASSLLQQICSLRMEETTEDPNIQLNVGQEQPTARPALIEVLSSTETVQPQQPKHRLTVNSHSNDSARRLKLHVQLPGVNSVSQCQLSISQDDVLLEVEDTYHLHLQFPEPVSEETCHATFNKKKHTLTVTASVLDIQQVHPQEGKST
ncbi:PIH1 domain-containing protein 2 [Trichomycterus rosablanca]|uniref:PIH1 domain-containing protein 2 n=1 Tax=Trichomycterus rosablanca TaxID=2290929 RepID=UPI002F3500FF